MEYPFPGNVRELAHAVERAVVLARGSEIDLEHLPEAIVGGSPESTSDARIEPLNLASKSFEKKHITQALNLAGGEHQKAAELLGISVKSLRQKMERLGIPQSAPRA
jgi:DNA-binding NtrC family response regulator